MCLIAATTMWLAGVFGPDAEPIFLPIAAILACLSPIPAAIGLYKAWRPWTKRTLLAAFVLPVSIAFASFPVLVVWAFSTCPNHVC